MDKKRLLWVPVVMVAGFLAIKPPALGTTQSPQVTPISPSPLSASADDASTTKTDETPSASGLDSQTPLVGSQPNTGQLQPPRISRGDDDDDYEGDDYGDDDEEDWEHGDGRGHHDDDRERHHDEDDDEEDDD